MKPNPSKDKWTIEFIVYGKRALFTDPFSKAGGEKTTTPIPSYDAIRGVVESIYFKPTINWVIESVRVMNPIIKHSVGVTPLNYGGGNRNLSYYTYLDSVAYQVKARIELNTMREDLKEDFDLRKHHHIALRAVKKGGRRDVFLGTRECQAYVEPCDFGSGTGAFDNTGTIPFGLMIHGLNYPDKTGIPVLEARLWDAEMKDGYIFYPHPAECTIKRTLRTMPIPDYTKRKIRSVEKEMERYT